MPPARVVPALDELEEREPGRGVRGEAGAGQELAFQGREEALAHRIVVAVADRAHRGSYAGLAAALAEGYRGVLRALVAMMDDVLRPSLLERHLEGVEHEFGTQVVGHGPTDDAPAADVQYHRQVQEARPGRHVGNVRHPQFVRARRPEPPLDQIKGRPGSGVTHRRLRPPAPGNAVQTGRRKLPLKVDSHNWTFLAGLNLGGKFDEEVAVH